MPLITIRYFNRRGSREVVRTKIAKHTPKDEKMRISRVEQGMDGVIDYYIAFQPYGYTGAKYPGSEAFCPIFIIKPFLFVFEFSIEGFSVNPEDLGCPGPVAPAPGTGHAGHIPVSSSSSVWPLPRARSMKDSSLVLGHDRRKVVGDHRFAAAKVTARWTTFSKFPDIPGPRIIHKDLHRLVGNLADLFFQVLGEPG